MYDKAAATDPLLSALKDIGEVDDVTLAVRRVAVNHPGLAVRLASHLRAADLLARVGQTRSFDCLAATYIPAQPVVHQETSARWIAKAQRIDGLADADLVVSIGVDDAGRTGVVHVRTAVSAVHAESLIGLHEAGIAILTPEGWSGALEFYPLEDATASLQHHRAFALRLAGAIALGIAEAAQADTVAFVHSRTRPWFEAATEAGSVAVFDEQQVIQRSGWLAVDFHIAEALLRRASHLATLAEQGDRDALQHVYAAAAEARAASGEVALTLASELFSICGTRSTDSEDDLGRHWRNARVHAVDIDTHQLWSQVGRHAQLFDYLPDVDSEPLGVISDAPEAYRTARKLAAEFRPSSATRDRERRHPEEALRRLGETGLLAIGVPAAQGGSADLSRASAYQVLRLLSTGDASVGQIAMIHFSFVDQIIRHGTDEQQADFIPEILKGARFSNGTAERHTENAKIVSTRMTPDGEGGFLLNGQKYYCTGSVGADWLSILAQDEEGRPVSAIVHRNDEGLVIEDDWNALGQRTTGSGGVKAVNVRVPARRLKAFWLIQDVPNIAAGAANLGHVAVDLGIAENAFDDLLRLINDGASSEADVQDRVHHEAVLFHRLGRLASRLHAAQQLFDDALAHYERITVAPITDEGGKIFSLEISEAKAFIGDLSYDIGNALFDLAGPAALQAADGYDRHWRNGRTHTLHDPNRWKYYRAGDHFLNGRLPPRNRNN